MTKFFEIGQRYKFINPKNAGTNIRNYWQHHNITDCSFRVESLDRDGDVTATFNGSTVCIAIKRRLQEGQIIKIEPKMKKFKQGKKYRYVGYSPLSTLTDYWTSTSTTDKTFVVHDVERNGDVIAMDSNGYTYLVATSDVLGSDFKRVKVGEKPKNFKVGHRYRIININCVQSDWNISDYWRKHSITDNTFVVDYVDHEGDAFCHISNSELKCVALKSEIDKWDIVIA